MATITVRSLDDRVKVAIEARARKNGRSMEAEIRIVLEESVEKKAPAYGMGSRIHELFAEAGGIDLKPVDRLRDERPIAANFD